VPVAISHGDASSSDQCGLVTRRRVAAQYPQLPTYRDHAAHATDAGRERRADGLVLADHTLAAHASQAAFKESGNEAPL